MKTRNRLIGLFIAIAVIFSSISFNSMAFAEENISDEILIQDVDIEEGLAEGEGEEEALPEGEEEGLPEEVSQELPQEELLEKEVVEEDLPKEELLPEDSGEEIAVPEVQNEQLKPEPLMVETQEKGNPNQYSIKTTDSTGNNVNDNFYDSKQDVYVRIDGEPFEYYVFVVSPNGTLLGSGGPFDPDVVFNLYDATQFDDTDNPGGSYNVWVGLVAEFDHSKMKNDHFKVRGPEPLGEIDITKIVKDKDEEINLDDETEFTFRLYKWVENKWEEVDKESPFNIIGNDTITIDNLPLGKYKVVEVDIPEGFELKSSSEVELELSNNHLEKKAEFTNKEIPPPPPGKGRITVHKRILRLKGQIDANLGNNTFTIRLRGPLDSELYAVRDLTINEDANGDNVTFDDLPFGDYIIEEIAVNGEPVNSSDYYIALPGNHGEDIGNEVEVDSNGTINRWLINKEKTPPLKGEIDISKKVIDEEDKVIANDKTVFKFRLYKWVDGEWEEVEGESPFYITGNATVTIDDLPLGKYKLVEVEVPEGYNLDSENDIEVVLNENNLEIKAEFTNKKSDAPPPWKGTIRIRKLIRENPNASVAGFEFELWKTGTKFAGPKTTNASGEVEFNNLPAGTYLIKEINTNYVAEYLDSNPVTIGPDMELENDDIWVIRVNNKRIPPPPKRGEIEVEKIVHNRSGNVISTNTRFYFELQMKVDGDWEVVDEGSILGNGSLVFDDLEDGEYRVREVYIDDDFRLVGTNNKEVEIKDASSEDVEFINRRVPPPPGDDDDDDDDNDNDNDDDDDDDEEEVPPDIPQAPPAIPVVPVMPVVPEVLEEVLEEVEIVEEPTPQVAPVAILPRTGAVNPTIFNGLGTILLGLGWFLKKKKD
ncbi:LPXTG cell wall anchor domain-containing protein [Tissierella creatinini]|nr:LPXTG cell wall anchor domain-containing protein [Tissierella creatinini]TJX63550.1 LPXTG cell wall anchor domain-containing protein [Soehngenia saccharolytica]